MPSIPTSGRHPKLAPLTLGSILVKLALDSGFASEAVEKVVHVSDR
jgi:hypothetical protein